jgi:hypothetical protein
MKAWWVGAVIVGVSGPAFADEVMLKGGGRVVGSVVARSNTTITIETGPGRLTLPLERVEKVTEGRSVLSAYQQRSENLRPDDVAGWLELGIWARDRGLATQARQAFERVAKLDPSSQVAQEALGNAQVDGRWVSQDEGQRLRGNVLFEGSWMTPGERDNILAQRQADTRGEQLRLESEARVREAEARTRQAEAEARRAEAETAAGPADSQVPWWLQRGSSGRSRSHRGNHEAERNEGGRKAKARPQATPPESPKAQPTAGPASPQAQPSPPPAPATAGRPSPGKSAGR